MDPPGTRAPCECAPRRLAQVVGREFARRYLQHPAFGHQARHQAARGDVEGRVVAPGLRRRRSYARPLQYLVLAAEFDGDVGAPGRGQVDRRGGGGHQERNSASAQARAIPTVPTLLAVSPLAAVRAVGADDRRVDLALQIVPAAAPSAWT